ncbi:unnamed protein product [Adineta ricciae]|uniref:Uncharacterized protein n=1 Tax=Adineta ricciae TaxID=249248 RepID=A0A814F1M9_ADIRI|nr:unnamed protein product [Adineta ricciae]
MINESAKTTHDRLDDYTAGCGPAQRSFPLAFCSWIDDDNLLDVSENETVLTHSRSLSESVAGVVNSICRSLLRNTS